MTLKLTPTTPADLPKIIEWEHDVDNSPYIGAYSLERHLKVITDPNERHFKFVNEKSEMIGYGILSGFTLEHGFIELRRIAIAEKGKGHGRSALRLIRDHCFSQAGCHRLWLDVYDFNQRARGLYLSEGFAEEGIIYHHPGNEGERQTLIVMLMRKGS